MIDAAKVYQIGYEVVADALVNEKAAHLATKIRLRHLENYLACEERAHETTRHDLTAALVRESEALAAGSELLNASLDKNRRLESCNAQIKSLRKALKEARAERDEAEATHAATSAEFAKVCESRYQWAEYATYLRNALHRAWNVPGAENR